MLDQDEPRRFRVLLIPEGVSPHTGYNWNRNRLAQLTVEEPATYYIVTEYSFDTKVDITKVIGYVEDLHLGPDGLYGWAKFFTQFRQSLEILEKHGLAVKPDLRAGFMLNPTTKEVDILEFKVVGITA